MTFVKRFCLISLMVITLLPPLPVHSESDIHPQTTTLTVLIPAWMQNAVNREFWEPFESVHPGVRVELARDSGVQGFLSGANGIEEYLQTVQHYVSAADVVFISSDQFNITPEATQAGFFLDLRPLIGVDPGLNPDDFYAPVWQSCQWDQGIWMVPFAAGVNVLVYDIAAFDRAGVAYPTENWTMTDLENAVRALSTDGVPGFITLDHLDALLYGLTSHPFYDTSDPVRSPSFTTPDLQTMIQTWTDLENDKAAVRFEAMNFDAIPLKIESPFRLLDGTSDYGISLLPGGRAGLTLHGFGVSAGTQQPELAYELAKYLSTTTSLADLFSMDTHARQSLSNNFSLFPPETQSVLQQALANAIPIPELRYGDYLTNAIFQTVGDQMDVLTALQNAEEQVLESYDYAAEQQTSTAVVVTEPPIQPELAPGEIALQFGINIPIPPLPNAELWDRVIADFVAVDPEVGQVNLIMQTDGPQPFEDVDCYFYPVNQLPSMNLATILNLDPLMQADASFDAQDMLPGVMQQVERDSMTWAYPLVIQPAVLWYNSDLFAQAGIPSPEAGWTANQFEDAVHQLDTMVDAPVFVPPMVGNSYLLTLFAAYGSVPLDYRTDPPTVNLTDPAIVDGIRQVLDLARAGIIAFQPLNVLGGGGGFSGDESSPVYADMLNMYSFRFRAWNEFSETSTLRFAPYPRGSRYIPVAYQLGAGYISAEAQNPEACYRWFNTLAQEPGLFLGMPARYSILADESLAAAQGQDMVEYYQTFTELLQSPDVIVFPEIFGSSGTLTSAHIEQMWLNDAINKYVVQEGVDLNAEFTNIATLISAYRECVAQIQPFDPVTETSRDRYTSDVLNCAFLVDPQMQTHMY